MDRPRIVIGISGATGAIYGIRLLELLRERHDLERHLILSRWAEETIRLETDYTVEQVKALADVVYAADDMGAAVSSGSFLTCGMVILPCSMKTLSAIANGYDHDLLARAADVTLKEGRTLVLCPRETPLNAIHLENMLKLSRLGVRMVPPIPSFYHRPQEIDELIRYQVVRVMDQFQLFLDEPGRWGNKKKEGRDDGKTRT